MKPMSLTLRSIALLLDYPPESLGGLAAEVAAALEAERALPARTRDAIRGFAEGLEAADRYARAETWVSAFDRGRATSLHLFEHVHGESRDRGQAMVDLKGVYERAGLALGGTELPDYLPAFLEYLSTRPRAEAAADLSDTAEVIRGLGDALARIGSRYALLPAALLELAGAAGLTVPVPEADRLAPIDREALDREWAEEPVTFGGCDAAPQAQTAPVKFYRQGAVA